MYYMWINKNLVHQVGDQTKVIIRCTVNQPSRVVLIQLSSWRWAQSCSKHVQDSNKHIIEEIVRQICHLPELYEDTRSEKYKI